MAKFKNSFLMAMTMLCIIGSASALNFPKEEILYLNPPLSLDEFQDLLSTESKYLREDIVSSIKEIVYQNGEIRGGITLKPGLSPQDTITDIKETLKKSNEQKIKSREKGNVGTGLIEMIKNTDIN